MIDGDLCVFCVMLVMRLDYMIKEWVFIMGYIWCYKCGGKCLFGLKYYDYCGCMVVEVVGCWELNRVDVVY